MISGSEAAYFSLSPNDIHKLKKQNSGSSARIFKLLQNYDYLLGCILLCNNTVNVAIVLLANSLASSIINFSQTPVLGFIVQVVVITFLLLLFGEIMPKFWVVRNAIGFANVMSRPLSILVKLTKPVSYLFVRATSKLNKRLNSGRKSDISMEDLSDAIDTTTAPSTDDKRMLKAIVDSTSTEVKEIMTPRIDITAVDIEINFDELCRIIVDCAYSRIPVCDDTLDNVKGVLYVKDLLPFINKDADFRWQSLIRTPYFIPEGKKINDLLGEFQQKKMHMAVVVDEYGGTSGIITLEDILEEIVGEIFDESDLEEDENLYSKIDDYIYLFEGKIPLNDFCKIMQIDGEFFEEEKGDAETLAGFILELKGDFPQKGESIQYRQFLFTVEAADRRRILKIKVTINHDDTEDET
jgi:gliding motility-associated protein GldE